MKKFTYFVAILLMAINSFAQHFVVAYTGNGQDHMNINVVTATIGGVALEAGDEIAAFDGTICCGKVTLTLPVVITLPATFAIIAASRKDDGQSNGYTVGHAITYKFWDSSKSIEISGISAEYFDNTGAITTAPTYTINGSAFVRLTVAAPANQAPVPNAGPDQSVNEGDNVTLDGSASSDADSNPLTYAWSAPAGITLSSTFAAKPTFTSPNVTIDTQYTFSLVVNDGLVNSGTDQVVITVKKVNIIPLANAGADQTINKGVIVTLNGTTSTDPDSDPLTYLWTPQAGITLSSNTASQPTFTAPEVTSDKQYTFSLIVNDGTVNSIADEVVITVKQVNKAPTANAGPNQSLNKGILVTLDGSASSDPDGDVLIYKWTAPAGITLSSLSTVNPTFTAPDVTVNTNYTFTLVVNDGKVDSRADQITITVKRGNQAPTANAGNDQSVNKGVITTLDGTTSTDPDSDPLTYLWTSPTGITMSSNTATQPTFTAPEIYSDTQYTFSLVVNDGTVNSTIDQVIVTVKNIDNAPYVKDPIKDVSVDKRSPNQVIDLRTVFADNDLGDVLSYIVSSNSNGNVVAATITGFDLTLIFSTENTGLAEIEITATSNGKEAKSKFQVEVKIPTGIDPLISNQNLKVYPNPTSGIIAVVFDRIPTNGTYLTVRSITGTTVLKKLIQDKTESIDLTGNAPGVYQIQTNMDSSGVKKIILK